jgi:hypothetical protein
MLIVHNYEDGFDIQDNQVCVVGNLQYIDNKKYAHILLVLEAQTVINKLDNLCQMIFSYYIFEIL